MKKHYLAVLLIALMGVSCSPKVSSKFKNYSYGRQLTNQETQELKEKVNENFQNLSKYKTNTVSYSDYGNQKNKTKSTSETTFIGKSETELKDGFGVHIEGHTSTEQTVYGIKSITKNENVTDVFALKNDSGDYYVVTGYYVDDDEPTISSRMIGSATAELTTQAVEAALYSPSYPSIYGDNTAYKNGSGYALVYSTISEQHYIQEAGSKYADIVDINQTQSIIDVNKDNQITKMKYVTEEITNRDPRTGEIFKEKRIISQTSTEYSFTYGDRETVSNYYHKYDNVINKSSVHDVSLTVVFGRYDSTNEYFSQTNSVTYRDVEFAYSYSSWVVKQDISYSGYYNVNAFYVTYSISGRKSMIDSNSVYGGTLSLNTGSSGYSYISKTDPKCYVSPQESIVPCTISFNINSINDLGPVIVQGIIKAA